MTDPDLPPALCPSCSSLVPWWHEGRHVCAECGAELPPPEAVLPTRADIDEWVEENRAWMGPMADMPPPAGMYFDHLGQPINQLQAMFYFAHREARHVAFTDLGHGSYVSTVHLVLNHGWLGPPLIFESMAFGPDGTDMGQDRYSTREDALAGHHRMVAQLRLDVPPPEAWA